jgi:hypothetical protein
MHSPLATTFAVKQANESDFATIQKDQVPLPKPLREFTGR